MTRCARLVFCCASFALQRRCQLNLHLPCRTEHPWRTTDLPFSNSSCFSQSKRLRPFKSLCWGASRSLYDTLGISSSAAKADIKQAYRKLALQYHPDVNKEPNAQQKFVSIKHAYQTLIDPISRLQYDSANRSRKADQFSGAYTRTKEEDKHEFYDLGEFWEDLQSSFEEFLDDMQAGFDNITAADKMKSLWEELADIGEDFVEFLEKEFNDMKQPEEQNHDTSGFDTWREPMSNFCNNENEMDIPHSHDKDLEMKINEIAEALAKLRKELGL